MRKFECTPGKSVRILTAISIPLMAGSIALVGWSFLRGAEYEPKSLAILIALTGLLIVPCVIAWMTVPKYIEVDRQKLTVMKNYGKKEILISDIVDVSRRVGSALNDTRIWGNGGFFGFTGTFLNKEKGRYSAYITNKKNMFWVSTVKKTYCMSCDNCDELIKYVNQAIRK